MVNFGAILKELRIQSGLTQKNLADKVGLTKSVISYYELQERSPSPEVLVKFSRIFHVSTDYLLGIEKQCNQTIDLSGLTSEDILLLQHTAQALREKNSKLQQ